MLTVSPLKPTLHPSGRPSLRQERASKAPHARVLQFGSGTDFAYPEVNFTQHKGARFVTTNRYNNDDVNWLWAGAVEDLAQMASQKINEFREPSALIEFLADQYRGIVYQYKTSYQYLRFGVPRTYLDVIPIGKCQSMKFWTHLFERIKTYFSNMATQKNPDVDPPYSQYIDAVGGGFKQVAVRVNDDPDLAGSLTDIHKVLNAEMDIDGQPVTLLKTYLAAQNGPHDPPVLTWVFDVPKAVVMKKITVLTQEALDLRTQSKNPETLQKSIRTIGTLHWLFACTMPYRRGSAGIADLLTKVLFDQLGIETPCWKPGLSPDLEAMATPVLEDYLTRYPTLFNGVLQFKSNASPEPFLEPVTVESQSTIPWKPWVLVDLPRNYKLAENNPVSGNTDN